MKVFAVLLSTLALACSVSGQYVGYGATSAAASETVSESVSSSSAVTSTAGVAAGSYGYGQLAGGSYGSSVSAASSTTTTTTTKYNYAETWSHLYQVPFFQNVCNLASNARTQEITQSLITQDFDFQTTFSTLWAQNPHLLNYIYGCVGFRATSVIERRNFYGWVNQYPGYILRALHLYAHHPFIFNTPFARYITTGTSLELIQSFYSYRTLYSYYAFSTSNFISYLVQSRSYRSLLCGYFGLSVEQYSESLILPLIYGAYQTNPAGTLLCLRHILCRRAPLFYRQYLSISVTSYQSRYASFWSRRGFLRTNPYFSSWNSYIASSSSSSSVSYSSKTASAYSGAAGGYYGRAAGGYYGGGAGYYGAGSAYGETVKSSQVVTSQSAQSVSAGATSSALVY